MFFEVPCESEVRFDIMKQLRDLQITVSEYLPPEAEDFLWLRNPFMLPLTKQGLKQTNVRN